MLERLRRAGAARRRRTSYCWSGCVELGQRVDAVDKTGKSALAWASECGRQREVKNLALLWDADLGLATKNLSVRKVYDPPVIADYVAPGF